MCIESDPSLVDRTMPMPWGEATGSAVAAMFMGDHFVHAWDVAKATGQSTDLDPEMAELVMRFAHDYVDVGKRRGPEMFDEERSAPPGATAQTGSRPTSGEESEALLVCAVHGARQVLQP